MSKIDEKLLEIDNKLNTILLFLSSIDLNAKTILAKYNKNIQVSDSNSKIESKNIDKPTISINKTNKIVIQQNLFYKALPEGKNALTLAQVKVFDSDKPDTIIFKTNSDMKGQWKATLPIGKFRICFAKASLSKDKPEIAHSIYFEFDGTQESPHKLEPLFF